MAFILDGLESEVYDRQYSDKTLVQRIGRYLKPSAPLFISVGFVLALASLSEFLSQVFISRSIDIIKDNNSLSTFTLLALAVIALGALSWFFNFLRQYLSGIAVSSTILQIRSDAFEKAIGHDLSFYDENSSGKVVSRVTTDSEDFANIIALVTDFISQCLLVIIFFVYIATISWKLSLVMLVMAPIALLVALSFRKIARFVTMNAKRVTAEVNSQIQESIAGIGVAKSFRKERSLWNSFKDNNKKAYRFGLRRGIVLNLIFPVMSITAGLGTGVMAFLTGLAARDGIVTLGEWFLFMQAVGYFWWPLLSIASFWSQLQDGFAAAERVFSLIDREPKVKQNNSLSPEKFSGSIEFKNTGFAYSSKEKVLDNFSLQIKAGEKIAIVGKTGAGKSSIVKLLCRFYEFQEGSIFIDNIDLRNLNLASLRNAIGLVSQDPFLFPGTVADNIRYAKPNASDSEILNAARSLGKGDWIDDLSQGIQTETGHRGSSLSMGQRQLVALTRVLIKNPALFILDEATSSVDPFTEAQIQDGLETVMKGRSAIVIAHRLSTVKFADRIIVLEKGAIIEEGTHEGLLKKGGNYASLYNTYFRHQSLDYIEKGCLD